MEASNWFLEYSNTVWAITFNKIEHAYSSAVVRTSSPRNTNCRSLDIHNVDSFQVQTIGAFCAHGSQQYQSSHTVLRCATLLGAFISSCWLSPLFLGYNRELKTFAKRCKLCFETGVNASIFWNIGQINDYASGWCMEVGSDPQEPEGEKLSLPSEIWPAPSSQEFSGFSVSCHSYLSTESVAQTVQAKQRKKLRFRIRCICS